MFERILVAIVLMIGSIPAAGIMVASTLGEYEYFLPYRYAGIAFFLLSPLAGLFIYPLWRRVIGLESVILRILLTAMCAYVVALLFLASMNLTSLCIGLENGDGRNSIGHCAIGTILNGIVFAVLALVGNLPGAVVYRYINKKKREG